MLITSSTGNKNPVENSGRPLLSMRTAAGHRCLSRTMLHLVDDVRDKKNFTSLESTLQ